MTREMSNNTHADINEFIGFYYNNMEVSEINLLNHTADLLTSGNISEAKAKSVLNDVRTRTLSNI